MREKLEPADALLLVAAERELAQRSILLERNLAFLEQLGFTVELRILHFFSIFVQALEALLDHHQIAQDQLGLDVLQVPHGDRPSPARAERSRPQISATRARTRPPRGGWPRKPDRAAILSTPPAHPDIPPWRGDLGRLEQLRQRVQARVRHLGDTGAHGRRADARLLMHTGQDCEQTCLAHHGQADNGSFHEMKFRVERRRAAGSLR